VDFDLSSGRAGVRGVNSKAATDSLGRVTEERTEYVSPAQRAALEAELAELEGPRRKAASEAIKHAREFGDIAENFEYHAAKNEQGLLERRIQLLKERLRHAVTVEHETDEHVGVGSIVEIADEDGETMEVEISAVGGVASTSPLGHALMGAVIGDVVDVEAPSGAWKARVISIRRAE
jgi:transcription elongation factor GreA